MTDHGHDLERWYDEGDREPYMPRIIPPPRHKPRWRQGTYELFAAVIGENAHDEFSRDDLIRGFSDLFACDNPRFNPDLFRERVIRDWMSRCSGL